MASDTGGRSPLVPPCVHLGFRLGETVLDFEVADDAAQRLVADAYAPLLCPASGARARASLRRLSDGRTHVRYGRHVLSPAHAADPVPLRSAYYAAREIFARFACEQPETIAVYGALCAIGHGAVLVLGPTTIGKTLLTLQLAHDGARFLGDETALLSYASGEVRALPRRPSLRESALPLLPHARMRGAILRSQSYFQTDRGRFWYALDSGALGGVEPSERLHYLRAVCILRDRSETAAVRRIDAAEGVKSLAQRAYMRPASLAQLAVLRRGTKRAAFFDVTLGTPAETSELLLQKVRACE